MLVLILLPVIVVEVIEVNCDAIILIPSGQRVTTQGSYLEFLCYAPIGQLLSIEWLYNNTNHEFFNLSIIKRINFDNANNEGNLIFPAISLAINNTNISCAATFTSGTILLSQKCLVYVQGTLKEVGNLVLSNLNSTGSLLTWTAPFTLELNRSPPHINYCIDIFNTHGLPMEFSSHILSMCEIRHTRFVFNYANISLNACYQFKYIVTPTNVVGNGTSSVIIDTRQRFDSIQPPSAIPSRNIHVTTLSILKQVNLKIYTPHIVHLSSINFVDNENTSYSFNSSNELILSEFSNYTILSLTSNLPFDKIFYASINITNCMGSAITSVNISTFLVQIFRIDETCNISNCLEINISYSEIRRAFGNILIILIPQLDNEEDWYYFLLTRQSQSEFDTFWIKMISIGSYEVLLYDLSRTGYTSSQLPIISTTASVNQGSENVSFSYNPVTYCNTELLNGNLINVYCNITYQNSSSHSKLMLSEITGFLIILQNTIQYQAISSSRIFGLISSASFVIQRPGTYKITVFPICPFYVCNQNDRELSNSFIYTEIIQNFRNNTDDGVQPLTDNIENFSNYDDTEQQTSTLGNTFLIIISVSSSFIFYTLIILLIIIMVTIKRHFCSRRVAKEFTQESPVYEEVKESKIQDEKVTFKIDNNTAYGQH